MAFQMVIWCGCLTVLLQLGCVNKTSVVSINKVLQSYLSWGFIYRHSINCLNFVTTNSTVVFMSLPDLKDSHVSWSYVLYAESNMLQKFKKNENSEKYRKY